MQSQKLNGLGSNSSSIINQNLYCQPCLKRGRINLSSYVNLNQFQTNRYICESCSFGQTYIIKLDKFFNEDLKRNVKLQNFKLNQEGAEKEMSKLERSLEGKEISENCQGQKINQQVNDKEAENKSIQKDGNLTIQVQNQVLQPQIDKSAQQTQQLNQFTKNIRINFNDQSTYSLSDIGQLTQKITHSYKEAMGEINRYQQNIQNFFKIWRSQLMIQYQAVLGTFSNNLVPEFLQELKKLQILKRQNDCMKLEFQQMDMKDFIQQQQNRRIEQLKINEDRFGRVTSSTIKTEREIKKGPEQLFKENLQQYQKQKQHVDTFVKILKMSGTRNLSNLHILNQCSKGFSQAVKVLINLQQKQTNRRYEFITERFMSKCSIDVLYDTQMIRKGLLDNKLQEPPKFLMQQTHIQKSEQKFQSSHNPSLRDSIFMTKNKVVSSLRKLASGQRIHNSRPVQQVNNIDTNQQAPSISISVSNSQIQLISSSQQQRQIFQQGSFIQAEDKSSHLQQTSDISVVEILSSNQSVVEKDHNIDILQIQSFSQKSQNTFVTFADKIHEQKIPNELQKIDFQGRQQMKHIQNLKSAQEEDQKGIVKKNQASQKRHSLNRSHQEDIQMEKYELEKIKLAKLKSKKPFASALLNNYKLQREQARQHQLSTRQRQNTHYGSQNLQNTHTNSSSVQQIDLQRSSQEITSKHPRLYKELPFESMKQYYSFERNRNVFMTKLQLTQQNYGRFPPPELYLPSVQSLVVKYCPDTILPWQLLKNLKIFRKLSELIIEEPKLATKNQIIMITQYFPKLKSLIIRCKNQFDWEVTKQFQKKFNKMIKFSVSDGTQDI